MGNANGKYKITTPNHMYSMGFLYSQGIFISQDYEEAINWFNKALCQGHAGAMDELSKCYNAGHGVKRDHIKAIDLCKKAAHEEHAGAQNNLGYYYQNGLGVNQDNDLAVEWFTKAAQQDHAGAQNNLGLCYYYGKGVHQSYKISVGWFTKAVQQGYANAQNSLAKCYYFGHGVNQNAKQAMDWWAKAARQGHADAQFNLGICYEQGKCVEQDTEQAIEWLSKAANQGHADAQFNLGVCYEQGKYVEQDNKQAIDWLSKAARQGQADAQYSLGVCYEQGKCVEQDNERAIEWLSKAARQGQADAQYYLGICYKQGKCVKQDNNQATEWLSKAANQGHVDAQLQLGICYEQGVDQNYEEAAKWYEAADKQGECNALFRLGSMYHEGMVEQKSSIRAADSMFRITKECDEKTLQKKALDYLMENLSENRKAGFYIAKCFQNGFGTEKNLVHAMAWYKQAAEYGYSEALMEIGLMHFEAKENDKAANFWFEGAKAPRNVPLNKQCFSLLAEMLDENSVSQFYIGECYSKGYGTVVNPKKSMEWCRKAANQGYAEAQNSLGQCIMNDKGVERDVNEALRLWHLAADQKHAGALFNLGVYFFYGLGKVESAEQAFEYYSKAALLGHSSAQCGLGDLYFNGNGVEQDLRQAFEWFRKAAQQDNAEAQFNVGVCYQYGYGVEIDNHESAYWYCRAANLGHAKAQNHLGNCYEKGRGVEQSLDQALVWYHRAAQQGEAIAFVGLGDCYYALKKYTKASENYLIASEKNYVIDSVRLGNCYYFNEDMNQDYKAAVKLYCEAAENDNAEAMYKLSNCYKLGHGVEKSSDEAFKWLKAAANHGYTEAQFDLGKQSERNGNKQDSLDWYHRAADQGHTYAQTIFNREESKSHRTKEVSKRWGKSLNNIVTKEGMSEKAQNDFMEVKDKGDAKESTVKRKKSSFPPKHITQQIIILNSFVTDPSKVINTGSTHNSLVLQVTSITENNKFFVAKVFPPVKEEEWLKYSNLETKFDLEGNLTEPMRRFLTERCNLRELAESSGAAQSYFVPMDSFGSIEYLKLSLIEPMWVAKSLDEEKLSEEDELVFPVIVMEKRSPNFAFDARQFTNSIAFLPEDIRSSGVHQIVARLISCLAHLHENNRVWCDCKPSNFVRKSADDNFAKTIAMIDLDGCVVVGNPVSKGTPLFMPPEYYEHDPLVAETSYDVWSLGVTLLILFSRTAEKVLYPHAGVSKPNKELPDKVLVVLRNADVKRDLDRLDRHLYIFIEGMLNKDPNERPSAAILKVTINTFMSQNRSMELMNKIYAEVVQLRGTMDESSVAMNYISQSVDLIHQDESKQLPRYYFATREGSWLFPDRYKFQLLCDGAWVFEEINGEGNNDITCDCSEFKVKIPKNTFSKFVPILFRVMKVVKQHLRVLSKVSPNQAISKSLAILNSTVQYASEAYKNMKQAAPLRELAECEDGEAKEREDEMVQNSFLTMFKFLKDKGLWDGRTSTGLFQRLIYQPERGNGRTCHVFLCRKHMQEALKYPKNFIHVDGRGPKGARE